MRIQTLLRKLIVSGASLAMMVTMSNCGDESLVQPNVAPSTETVTRKTSELTFLNSKNPFSLMKIMEVRQLITVAKGGTLEAGDDTTGISRIIFNPGDVKEDLTVSLWWDSQRFQAEFGPHGSQFNNPVTIRLSYKDADLTGLDEDNLEIWYYDENDSVWELTGQVVNKEEKYVEGSTTHFSRYAVAASRQRMSH